MQNLMTEKIKKGFQNNIPMQLMQNILNISKRISAFRTGCFLLNHARVNHLKLIKPKYIWRTIYFIPCVITKIFKVCRFVCISMFMLVYLMCDFHMIEKKENNQIISKYSSFKHIVTYDENCILYNKVEFKISWKIK